MHEAASTEDSSKSDKLEAMDNRRIVPRLSRQSTYPTRLVSSPKFLENFGH